MTEFRSVDPCTGRARSEHPEATPAQIDAALTAVSRRFRAWSRAPTSERASVLRTLADRLQAGKETYASLMAEEVGKPVSQGAGEVDKCAWACRYAAERAGEWLMPVSEPTEARRSYVRFDPLGPVLAIMPWNFPFWQLFRFGASALMAGDTILLKHAPNAPRCAAALHDLFLEVAGEGLLVNLYAALPSVPAILGDARIAAVTLTGSTRAGRAVAAIAGQHLKPAVLELGGSDAFLVMHDADVEAAATVAAASRLQNNGQSCIAAKRFLVDERVADDFIAMFREKLAAAVVGDPREAGTTVGPLARADLREALHDQVLRSESSAELLLGGRLPEGPGFFYPPSLLLDRARTSAVFQEETFGPVAAVSVVRGEDEMIEAASATCFGLGATIFSSDLQRAEQIAALLRVGAVFVNGLVRSDPRLPFGGALDSGYGRELGREGMRAFTITKTVWVS